MYEAITAEQARNMTVPMSAEERQFKLIFDKISEAAKNGIKGIAIDIPTYYPEQVQVYIDKLIELGYQTNTARNTTYTQTLSIRWY